MESISLIDAVYSARLTTAGLPALANVQAAQTLVEPTSDPYAAPSSTLTTLSGYGQLLSSASRASDELQGLLGSNSNLASSSATSVATASADASATAGSYAVAVSQIATAHTLVSGYFTNADTKDFSAGTINVSVAGSTPVSVTLTESASLNELATAINAASTGVTATVENGTYGYSLKLTADSTGAANTIALTANQNDPFDGGTTNLATLAFTQSQTAQDASYTVDAVPGTSASNTNIALATGATFSLVGAGSATITVATTPFVAADSASITTAATQLVSSYNALIGTAAQLIGSSGALNGDTTTATPLSNTLYDYTQGANKTYANGASSLTELSHLGITGTGQATGALSLNTTTLDSTIASDTAGAASLLTTIANTLHSIISGYLGNTGTILTQAKTTEESMAFLDGQPASNYPYLANDIKQYVLQKSLISGSAPTGLPEISVFS